GLPAAAVLAAPGLGKAVIFAHGIITINATAGVYTNIGGTAATFFDFEYHGSSSASGPLGNSAGQVTELLGGDAEVTIAIFTPLGSVVSSIPQAVVYDASELANLPLSVYGINAAAGAFTGGNAANTGRAKVWYSVETLA